MRILYLPLDSRPCNYLWPQRLLAGTEHKIVAPPAEIMDYFRRPADSGLSVSPESLYVRRGQNSVTVSIADVRILPVCLIGKIGIPLRAVLHNVQIPVVSRKEPAAVQFRLLHGFENQPGSLKRKADRNIPVFFGDLTADLLCRLLRGKRMHSVCPDDKSTVLNAACCIRLSDCCSVAVKLLLIR